MIRSIREIIGNPVVTQEEGMLVALIQDAIIHPDTGKIEAFWIKPLTLPIRNAVIQTDSIVEWKKNIYIGRENDIADPEDIIKISEILSRQTVFISNHVISGAGVRLGRVYDLDFDTNKLYLRNLYVQKSFLGFKFEQRVFNYDSIIEVQPDHITVKDKQKGEETVLDKQPLLDV